MISNKEKNFISAVIYVHNNEKYIADFLINLNNVLNDNFDHYEIICVDDKSTDESVKEIKKVSKKLDGAVVNIVYMSYYQGLEMSMNAGIDLAIGDFVYEFDNIYIDYSNDVIIDVYKKTLEGYDIVSAESNSKKRLSSKLFYKLFNKNSDSMYNINTETFRILSRRAINRVKSINATIPYRKAVYANCGLKVNTMKYNAIKDLNVKLSKEVIDSRKDLAVDSIILFTNVAYKLAIALAIIMMIVAIGTGIYTVYVFFSSQPVAGWTTTMLFLSFAFSGMFAILTIIIKYCSIIIDLIFKKQKYLIENVEKVTK